MKIHLRGAVSPKILQEAVKYVIMGYGGHLMVAIIVGIVLIAFTVFAALPGGLAWGAEIIAFLKELDIQPGIILCR